LTTRNSLITHINFIIATMATSADAPAKSGLGVFWWAARHPPTDPTTSCTGKTVLITGANVGLGFEAATKFAALGAATLIFGVRSLGKGKAAKAQIERAIGCKSDIIQIFELDMSSYSSIEKFAKVVSNKFPKIDAAILNAGVAASAYNVSPHGWEMSLQVNVISTTYLAILLLPKLRETALSTRQPACLEFVASAGHGDVKAENIKDSSSILKKANDRKNFSIATQYINTKLMEMWAMGQIASKTSPAQVIVTSSCPGLCRSNLGRDFIALIRIPNNLFQKVFARSSEEGSRTIVSATSLGAEGHGGFWTNDKVSM